MEKGGNNFRIKDKPKTQRPEPPKGQGGRFNHEKYKVKEPLISDKVWEEEFEDSILLSEINTSGGTKGILAFPSGKLWALALFNLSNPKNIKQLFDKYFKLVGESDKELEGQVKIKCRKGAILIEEVKR